MDNAAYKKSNRKNLFRGLLFTSPVILGYTIFVFIPLIVTIVLSFSNFSFGAKDIQFTGFDNYKAMLSGQDIYFWPSVKATLYYVFGSVPIGIVFSFFVAILLNMNIKGRALFRGVFYLPMVIPLAAGCMIWMWLLQPDFGIVNQLLRAVGFEGSTWLASDTTVIPTFIIFSLWICGNTIVIFLAGLQDIPRHLYEAIDVDGGNAWHKLIYITIPMMSPIIFFNTVIGFINAFQTFVQPAVMTSGGAGSAGAAMGGPNNASLLFVLNIYQNAFRFSEMGSASAGAVVLLVIIGAFTAVFFKLQNTLVHYEGDGRK